MVIAEEQQNPTYHYVFSSLLMAYFNLKKEIDSGTNQKLEETKKKEIVSLLRSAYIYSVQIKRNAPENLKLPKASAELVKYLDDKIEELKNETRDYIEALFVETVAKMEIAGLTPTQTSISGSFMDMQIAEKSKK